MICLYGLGQFKLAFGIELDPTTIYWYRSQVFLHLNFHSMFRLNLDVKKVLEWVTIPH